MRIVKPPTVRQWMRMHPNARASLARWLELTAKAQWTSLGDIRKAFRACDEVRVGSDRVVVVFNIGGNNFRLVCAVHYNLGRVFVLRFMTHAQYSEDRWKAEL